MNWIELATKYKRFRIKEKNSEINIKLEEERTKLYTKWSSGVCKNADDSSIYVYYGHRPRKKKWGSLSQKAMDWKPWDCVSVSRSMHRMCRSLYLFFTLASFLFYCLLSFFLCICMCVCANASSPNSKCCTEEKNQNNTEIGIKNKKKKRTNKNKPQNMFFLTRPIPFINYARISLFIEVLRFKSKKKRIFPYDSKSNVVRIDSAKWTEREDKTKKKRIDFISFYFASFSLFWHRLPVSDSKHR